MTMMPASPDDMLLRALPDEVLKQWVPFGILQASQWGEQAWDPDVLASFLRLATFAGVDVTPREAMDALMEWAATPGDDEEAVRRRRFSPRPQDLLEVVRERQRRDRPALPPPPGPDDQETHLAAMERWEAQAPSEQVERLRRLTERLRTIDPDAEDAHEQRQAAFAAYFAGPAPARSAADREREHEARLRQVEEAQARPITAAQIAEVEALVRAGREHLVAERYRHLLPGIRARVQAEQPREAANG